LNVKMSTYSIYKEWIETGTLLANLECYDEHLQYIQRVDRDRDPLG